MMNAMMRRTVAVMALASASALTMSTKGPLVTSGLSRRNLLGAAAAVGGGGALAPAAARAASAPAPPKVFSPAPGTLADRTILITGANTGLGLESAVRLAAAGADVVVTARTAAKVDATVAAVRARAGAGARVRGAELDLASLASVRGFRARLRAAKVDRLDVLLNNAGVMAIPERLATRDGFERQIGVNHLGHFALVGELLPLLRTAKKGAEPRPFRVINVASTAQFGASAAGLRDALDRDLEPAYSQWGNYCLSKAANVLFADELQRRFDAAGVRASAVSLHPGAVATDLARYLVSGTEAAEAGASSAEAFAAFNPLQRGALQAVRAFVLDVPEGASTQVYLAAGADTADGDLGAHGGLYYDRQRPATPNPATNDRELARRLWEVSEKLTGAKIVI